MTFFAQCVFYELSVVVYTTVRSDATALSEHLRATEILTLFFSLVKFLSSLIDILLKTYIYAGILLLLFSLWDFLKFYSWNNQFLIAR